ncbi:MAG: Ribosomal large subunit pseudouridine synthase [Myxococcales bacterium]|nr:Ribosomal large subunit pseudouridine synthase [Myxococcales bacterium]
MQIRLQRFLAQAGVASRRKAEELIVAGKVKVNGNIITELGTKVDPDADKIVLGGKRLLVERPVYLMLNKPRGYVTTMSDPEGRPTVLELLKRAGARVFPVGRLDFNTEGLLICTNDGDLAHALMHPKHEVRKTYHVKLQGQLGPKTVSSWMKGVTLDDGDKTAPAEVEILGDTGKNTWLEVTIHEGKNRQIHRTAEALGFNVLKLTRVSYGGLHLEELRVGTTRHLLPDEIDKLRRAVGGSKHTFEKVRKRAPSKEQNRRRSRR